MVAAAAAMAIACGASNETANNAGNTNSPIDPTKMTIKTPTPEATIDLAAMGTKVYEENCVQCHKPDGSGGDVTVDGKELDAASLISEHMTKHDDAKIIKHITEGVPEEGMPAFKDKLSETQLRAVVTHIRELQRN
jgi:putative copper resistance protein D